jgi:NADP-dependent 3-hydroxy acid dehydrogenase YdfG
MKTVVITGGTRGIGRGLALRLLGDGDQVIAVGSNAANGQSLVDDAAGMGAGDRVRFIEADLSSVAETTAVVDELTARYPVVDQLVFCAGRYNTRRVETSEGLEQTFALYVLNRFLLAEQLREQLERAPTPVILNVCGTGMHSGEIDFSDLQLTKNYTGLRATLQGVRLNNLVATAFAARHPDTPIRYVLSNPMLVDTGQSSQYRQPMRTIFRGVVAAFGVSVDKAVVPLLELLTNPPAQSLSAFRKLKPVDLNGHDFDRDSAERVYDTLIALASAKQPPSGAQRPAA